MTEQQQLKERVAELERRMALHERVAQLRVRATGVPLARLRSVVCSVFGISQHELGGRARPECLVTPRRIFCYLARTQGVTCMAVAHFIRPDMNHSTVTWHEQVVRDRMSVDAGFRATVHEIADLAGIKLEGPEDGKTSTTDAHR